MNDCSDGAPMACSLTTAELRNREATLLAEFKSAVRKTEELPQGYAFRLPGDSNLVRLMAELIGSDNWPCWHEGVLEIGLVQVGESIEENSRRVVGTLEPSDAFLGH